MTENVVPILLFTSNDRPDRYIVYRSVLHLHALEISRATSGRGSATSLQQEKRAVLVGFSGKAIWDALKIPQASGCYRAAEPRYAFVLARHVEQVIDQGQLDRQRNRESVPESSAPIGGLRGEVQSWLPQSYVQRFIGGRSVVDRHRGRAGRATLEVRGLVDEILHKLNMTDQGRGLGSLITSHTLDFISQAEAKSTMRPRRAMRKANPKHRVAVYG